MKLEFEFKHSFGKKFQFNAHRNFLSQTTFTNNWHEEIELLFVEQGQGFVIINYIPYQAKEGDIFIINSNQIHCISNENTAVDSISVFSVIIPEQLFSSIGVNSHNIMFEFKISDYTAVKLFKNLIAEDEKADHLQKQSRYSALAILVIYLLRNHTIESTKKDTAFSKIQYAFDYIKNHLSEDISGSDLAKQVGLSNGHFLRMIKKYTGFTFSDILNRSRCAQACILLCESELSLLEISIQCGYNNFSYFSRTFKKLNGVSPLKFRKKTVSLPPTKSQPE